MARKFVERGLWVRDLTLDDFLSVYKIWNLMHSAATAGNQGLATEYAREILRSMTNVTWWPRWRIRRNFRKVLDAAGIGRDAPPTERDGAQAMRDLWGLVVDLAGRARKTPMEVAKNLRPEELGEFAASLHLAEVRESQARVRDHHHNPKDRMKDLESLTKKIKNQMRRTTEPPPAIPEKARLRLIETPQAKLGKVHL